MFSASRALALDALWLACCSAAAAWDAASAEHAPSEEDARINDAVLALISLGYKQVDAHKAVKRALADAGTAGVTLSLEDLVRQALKLMI